MNKRTSKLFEYPSYNSEMRQNAEYTSTFQLTQLVQYKWLRECTQIRSLITNDMRFHCSNNI